MASGDQANGSAKSTAFLSGETGRKLFPAQHSQVAARTGSKYESFAANEELGIGTSPKAAIKEVASDPNAGEVNTEDAVAACVGRYRQEYIKRLSQKGHGIEGFKTSQSHHSQKSIDREIKTLKGLWETRKKVDLIQTKLVQEGKV